MTDRRPVIWWVRRDMRLVDNPALTAAVASGAPVIPVFLLDEVVEGHGALPKWRLLLAAGRLDVAPEELHVDHAVGVQDLRVLVDRDETVGVAEGRHRA